MSDQRKRTKFFIDTEFIESGPRDPIQLLSIGMVREDGMDLYLQNGEADWSKASPWVKEHVLPILDKPGPLSLKLSQIQAYINVFVDGHNVGPEESWSIPEFWGYYADYDWVVFCQIFGTMSELPRHWPKYCRDIKQLADSLGNPQLPKQDTPVHDALNDAWWNKKAYDFLMAKRWP